MLHKSHAQPKFFIAGALNRGAIEKNSRYYTARQQPTATAKNQKPQHQKRRFPPQDTFLLSNVYFANNALVPP
jgi:hypothetical protein